MKTIRNDGGEHAQKPTENYGPIPGGTQLILCPSLETPIGFLVSHQASVLCFVADPLRRWCALNGPGVADRPLELAKALFVMNGGWHIDDIDLRISEDGREGLGAGGKQHK